MPRAASWSISADQLAGQPAQPVEVKHDKHVALAQEVETGRKAGPFGLGSRRAILEDPLAACLVQRVELAIQNLRTLGGGDARIADQSHDDAIPITPLDLTENLFLGNVFGN